MAGKCAPSHHKKQHFGFVRDVPFVSSDRDVNRSNLSGRHGTWRYFDKQILCFYAYFTEPICESQEETYRVRKCKIYYYLEDDTMQVVEPPVSNSCMTQGTLIRRHYFAKSSPNGNQSYTLDDLNVGKEVNIYGKNFRIVDCDKFTRSFLTKIGHHVQDPEIIPEDPYTEHQKKLKATMKPHRPYKKVDTLKQFLNHNRHVLRFYCLWDDRNSTSENVRKMILHYYLEDDSIEILESISPNSGRDACSCFLRRSKLPKLHPRLITLEIHILKVFFLVRIMPKLYLTYLETQKKNGWYIYDNQRVGSSNMEYYHDSDLRIGVTINVWGRNFLLYDCDEFTKQYYHVKYGLEMKPLDMPQEENISPLKNQFPSYNGFGSEEDSLGNCLSLLPKPPRKTFSLQIKQEGSGKEIDVLRFSCCLVTTDPVDSGRRFILSYFLSDSTIQIYEPPVQNSGLAGGKFLERGRVKKPEVLDSSSTFSQYYTTSDMYIGAVLHIVGLKFLLTEADEFALSYMEQHPEQFPKADITKVMQKLEQILNGENSELYSSLKEVDSEATDYINFQDFRQQLLKVVGTKLTEHEILTIARRYRKQDEHNGIPSELLVAFVQNELRKKGFSDFENLGLLFKEYDAEKTHKLSKKKVYITCRIFHLPVAMDILLTLLDRITDDNGMLDYHNLVRLLDWEKNPSATTVSVHPQFERKLRCITQSEMKIDYKSLIGVKKGNED
ncbi:EF-hand domain-containing family member C2-like [Limulus polyphemus]|uniref:EF-hand domain-containing family member C2 n=1 Tax=Limulus polyphemus TaxID=6850 RepID=A0ABM1STE0_LIMPO|nr:EF-hand domain-containing family member C2-like [Limulus polyphemus]